MRRWLVRIERAFLLDPELFEEVEHDHSAGPQALAVVLAASVAGGAGNVLAALVLRDDAVSLSSMLVTTAGFVVGWIAWSFVMVAIGTSLFGGRADMGEMQRALGFAAAPGILMIIPGLGMILGGTWCLAAMILAVRQALDVPTARAAWTVVLGAVVALLVVVPAACAVGRHVG